MIRINQYNYTLILVFLSSIKFLVDGSFGVFDWPASQDIPIILNLINPDFLLEDFYTTNIVKEPRIALPSIVYTLTLLGFKWYEALYFLKVMFFIFAIPLQFLFSINIYNFYRKRIGFSDDSYEKSKFIFMLCSIGLLSILQSSSHESGLAGWCAIQEVTALTSMYVSFVFGLAYNALYFKEGKWIYLSIPVLLLSTWIHPVIGIFNFVISVIFTLPFYHKKIIHLFLIFIAGVLTPILFLVLSYSINNGAIDSKIFIENYVFIRHPHHYMMSYALNNKSIIWSILLLIPVVWAMKLRDGVGFFLSILVALSFLGATAVQYLSTEVFYVKSLAILGPSRYTSFISLIWSILFVLVLSIHALRKGNFPFEKMRWASSLKTCSLFAIREGVIVEFTRSKIQKYIWVVLFFPFVIYILTVQHPLDAYKHGKNIEVLNWLSKNTPQHSLVFAKDIDPYMVRVFAHRPIFGDKSFTFNENTEVFFENMRRMNYASRAKTLTDADFSCLYKNDNVRYLISSLNTAHKSKEAKISFSEYTPVYQDSFYMVYDLIDFIKNKPCKDVI